MFTSRNKILEDMFSAKKVEITFAAAKRPMIKLKEILFIVFF
jgi:hypothetical protein